jgi:hypothetical protein
MWKFLGNLFRWEHILDLLGWRGPAVAMGVAMISGGVTWWLTHAWWVRLLVGFGSFLGSLWAISLALDIVNKQAAAAKAKEQRNTLWEKLDTYNGRNRIASFVGLVIIVIVVMAVSQTLEGDPRITLYVQPNNESLLLVESLGKRDGDIYIKIELPSNVTNIAVDSPERLHVLNTGPHIAPFAPSVEISIPQLAPFEKRGVKLTVSSTGSGGTYAVDASSQRCGDHCKNVIIFPAAAVAIVPVQSSGQR